MNKLIKFLPMIFVAMSLTISGCSKNGSPTTSQADKDKAVQRVTQANQIFVPRLASLIATQGKDTSGFNMSSATSLYKEALTYDPDNLDAHFGVGATELFTIFSNPAIQSILGQGNLTLSLMKSSVAKKQNMASLSSATSAEIQSKLELIKDPLFPLKVYKTFSVKGSSEPFSYYQGIIETNVLPALADAITNFNAITSHSDYIFYITPQQLGVDSGDSIRIGLTEIYALLSICQVVDGLGSFAVAYNVDYNSSDSSAILQEWQTGSAFLSLRSGGSQRMKDVKTNFVGAANNIQNGINFLIQHPGNGIIPYRPEDGPQLTEAKSAMDSVKKYFAGAVQISVTDGNTTTSVNVNFGSLFDNAISNFKQKLPAYNVSVMRNPSGKFDAKLTWQATSFSTWTFPDPAFNGLFPGMTDSQLKQTFGITAANWPPYVTISE